MKKENERGAVIVEATISLPIFVFAIFTILSVINICYIQARIGNALNLSAKEISQYSYLYYKFGADKKDAGMSEGTDEARGMAEDTISGIVSVMDSLSGAKNSASTKDFDNMVKDIEKSKGTAESVYKKYGDKIADNPMQFIVGFGKMALGEVKEEVKAYLGAAVAKSFMKKNLKAYKSDDPDSFLKRYRVVNGLEGLNFNYTTLMAYGSDNNIQLVCSYQVSVIKLLNIEVKFDFRNIARTEAWGNGIAKMQGQTQYILDDGYYTSIGGYKVYWDDGSKSFIVVDTINLRKGFTEKEFKLDPGTVCFYDYLEPGPDKATSCWTDPNGRIHYPEHDSHKNINRPVVWTGKEWLDMQIDGELYVARYENRMIAYDGKYWYEKNIKNNKWMITNRRTLGWLS